MIDMRRDVFQAIADPVRRDIISLLAKKTLTVNAIADQFQISRPAISKHLKILRECGIIHIEHKGRERYCHIQAHNLIPAFIWLEQYKTLWEERIDSFEAYLLRIYYPETVCEFVNVGLLSETVSGLSEPNHADGRFPRPAAELGHWLMAKHILLQLGENQVSTIEQFQEWIEKEAGRKAIFELINQRQQMMKDAWLTHIGHSRPEMRKGKPFQKALAQAVKMEEEIIKQMATLNHK